jgi:uncharacterized protein YqhQ
MLIGYQGQTELSLVATGHGGVEEMAQYLNPDKVFSLFFSLSLSLFLSFFLSLSVSFFLPSFLIEFFLGPLRINKS